VDVHHPATDRKFARLLDEIDTSITRRTQPRRQLAEIQPLSCADPESKIVDRPRHRYWRTQKPGRCHDQIHRLLRDLLQQLNRPQARRQRRLGTEIGARELGRREPDSQVGRQKPQTRRQILSLRDVRHNDQGEALWPSVGSNGRHRQRTGTRNHATDREPGCAIF
jgi:hypothetical protein